MDYKRKLEELQKEFRTLFEENERKFKEADERKEKLSTETHELIAKNNQRMEDIDREQSLLKAQQIQHERASQFDDPIAADDQRSDDEPVTREKRKDVPLGQFYQHVMRAAGGQVQSRTWLEERAATGMGEDSDPTGGYLVPVAQQGSLLQTIVSGSDIASRCRQVPISIGKTADWPAVNETSRVDGSRLGGIQTYWEGEADTITSSRPKFRNVHLDLKKLTALVYVTEEMMQDAPQAEAFIGESLPREFRTVLDNAILRGTGAGQPLGVLNSACLVSISKESSGNGAGTLVFQNVSKMLDRALDTRGAVWLRNQDTGNMLRSMTVGDQPIYLANLSATSSPQESLFGYPTFVAEQCSSVGTVGDIILGNFGYYLLGQKGGIQTASSIHVQFLTAQTAFRFILRVDGQPWTHSAITPMNGTNTLSPFVVTETRS